MKNLICFFLMLGMFFSSPLQAQELIANGSFNGDPSFSSWRNDLAAHSHLEGGNPGGFTELNHTGSRNSDPAISQVIKTKANTRYIIRGDYRGGRQAHLFCKNSSRKAFAVDVNGKEVGSYTLPDSLTTWTAFEIPFTARATSTTIRLRGEINGSDCDVAIDNISVTSAFVDRPIITAKGGNWKYGYGKPGEGFTEFNSDSRTNKNKVLMKNMKGGYTWLSAAQNTTKRDYTNDQHDVTYPSKELGGVVLHPGNKDGDNAKMLYTARGDGEYTFELSWKLVDQQGQKVGTQVYTNAVSKGYKGGAKFVTLLNETLERKGSVDSKKNSITLNLKKGEQVYIEVDRAGAGPKDHQNDSTLVIAIVK